MVSAGVAFQWEKAAYSAAPVVAALMVTLGKEPLKPAHAPGTLRLSK